MHLLPQEGILFVAFAIIVILLIAKLATSPIQAMVKLLVNSMAAVMLLCFISIVGISTGNWNSIGKQPDIGLTPAF